MQYYTVSRCSCDGDVKMITCGLFSNAMQWLVDRASKHDEMNVKWEDNVGDYFLCLSIKHKNGEWWTYALKKHDD